MKNLDVNAGIPMKEKLGVCFMALVFVFYSYGWNIESVVLSFFVLFAVYVVLLIMYYMVKKYVDGAW